MHRIKFIYEYKNSTVTFDLNADITCTEITERFKDFLLAATYGNNSIRDALMSVAMDMGETNYDKKDSDDSSDAGCF